MTTAAIEINPQFARALELLEHTASHCFITGKAGTGKSTLLQYFRDTTKKQVAVLAPTGVAAVNIRGQTIHSFFRFKPDITPERAGKLATTIRKREPKSLYTQLHTIVLDEISMVRADLFECIDLFLRVVRGNNIRAFGGVQLVLIGDLYQLPPVVRSDERELFHTIYPGPYFFNAPIYAQLNVETIELEKIYRQKDEHFIRLLNAVRNNTITPPDIDAFNVRYEPDFEPHGHAANYITLTAMNEPAQRLNAQRLAQLDGKMFTLRGETAGDFKPEALPTDVELKLKIGAQVMLLNNDPQGRWVNGTIGTIEKILPREDIVVCTLPNGESVEVQPFMWELFHYELDAKKNHLTTETIGTFTQLPLKLAWAVTIHKSQGKTFDHVIIDVGRGTFATGQMYVALSRARTLEGIVLRQRLRAQHVRVDYRIVKFLTGEQYARSETACPLPEKMRVIATAIAEQQALAITYLKASDVRSERVIEPREMGEMEFQGKPFFGLRGFCRDRHDERVFRVDRILELKVVAGD